MPRENDANYDLLTLRGLELFTPQYRAGSGEPLVLIHGFMDSWRTWELVIPALSGRFDVIAPTLPGHAGGPPLAAGFGSESMADFIESVLDREGLSEARVAGNSLGGYVALQLAQRGRARSVVALAPAGGWPPGDDAPRRLLEWQRELRRQVKATAPHAQVPDAVMHQMLAVARCEDADRMIDAALGSTWTFEAVRIECPVRIVWGADDQLLPWPDAAERYRRELPHADWIELDGVGHYPQLEAPLETAELIAGF